MNLISFIPGIIKGISGYVKGRQELATAKSERKDELKKLALTNKLAVINTATEADMKLDNQANQRIGWADDVSFAVFLLPAILAFYPPALLHIKAGFVALELMPQWYQYALGMMLISVWGYRRLVTPIILTITKAYINRK